MMRACHTLPIGVTALIALAAAPVASQTDVWIVGKGGRPWQEPAKTIAGLVVGDDEELRPVNFEKGRYGMRPMNRRELGAPRKH